MGGDGLDWVWEYVDCGLEIGERGFAMAEAGFKWVGVS